MKMVNREDLRHVIKIEYRSRPGATAGAATGLKMAGQARIVEVFFLEPECFPAPDDVLLALEFLDAYKDAFIGYLFK